MRRAILLAGGLAMLGLGFGCDHFHGVYDCTPPTNTGVCGFYTTPANVGIPAGNPGLAPTTPSPPLQMPKATEPLPAPKE